MSADDLDLPDGYMVLEDNPDGTVLIAPDTSYAAMAQRAGLTPVTDDAAQRWVDEHRHLMLPPDGEG